MVTSEIRKAKQEDLSQVLYLYQQLNPTDQPMPSRDEVAWKWNQILGTSFIHLFVAEENGTLIGTCMLTIIPNLTRGCASYALIENVVTDQRFRRKGLGTKILQAALSEAWQSGCYKVMLLTGSKRPEVLSFYERAGFEAGKKTGFVAYPAVRLDS